MKMEMTVREMDKHVRELAQTFNIRLVLDYRLPVDVAGAFPEQRTVIARPVTNDTSYVVVLHEQGHIVHPSGSLKMAMGVPMRPHLCKTYDELLRCLRISLDEEEAAWSWARAMALQWTTGMEQVYTTCLGTYQYWLRHFEERGRR